MTTRARRPEWMLLLPLLLALPAVTLAGADTTSRVVVVSWNVENLFDADDDPANPGDDEYTAAGWTHWTPQRYALKLTNLASVVAALRPDILCLSEIENRRVLDDLSTLLATRHQYALPVIIHRDGPDQRGIDTAILARWAPIATNWLALQPLQRETIVADFDIAGRRLTVLANHWKSHYGSKSEATRIRVAEARGVRAELDRRLTANAAAAIVVAGDFNDDVNAATLVSCAGFALDADAVRADGRLLYNLAARLTPEARATYYYAQAKRWNSFDSLSVTAGMLSKAAPAAPWLARLESYRVHAPPEMRREGDGAPLPFRRVGTRSGHKVYSGFSDHFPVQVTLQAAPAPVEGAP